MLRASGLRLSGIRRREMAITATASGRLIKNTQRQEACPSSQPPSTGPIAVVMAVNPDHVPIACPRLFSSKEDRKSTRLNSSHQIISYAVFCLKKKKYI